MRAEERGDRQLYIGPRGILPRRNTCRCCSRSIGHASHVTMRVSKGSGKYTPTPYGEQLRSLNDSCNPPLKLPNRLVFSRSPLAPSPRQLRSSASHARTGHLRGTRGVSRQEACDSARAGLTPPGSVNGRNGLAQAWRPEARRGVRGARSSRASSP